MHEIRPRQHETYGAAGQHVFTLFTSSARAKNASTLEQSRALDCVELVIASHPCSLEGIHVPQPYPKFSVSTMQSKDCMQVPGMSSLVI